ncbi:hypothetical protein Tco_1033820 [Tanacetum coccineum]
MVEENVPAPTRSDDQLVPVNARLPYGKSNLLLDLQKLQKNHIFHILDAKSGVYSFQLDEQWFTLNVDLLRNALEITPVDLAHPFVSPRAGEQVMDFVNKLGYPEEIHFVSKMHNFYGKSLYKGSRLSFLIGPILVFLPRSQLLKSFLTAGDDFLFGNLKFIPKGEKDEGKVLKVRKGKRSYRFVDEEDEEPQPTPKPQIENDEYNLQRGKGKGIATDEQSRTPVTEEASTRPLAQLEDDTSANIVHDTPSPPDVKTGAEAEMSDSEGDTEILNVSEEKGEDVSNTVALEERTIKLNEGQVGVIP